MLTHYAVFFREKLRQLWLLVGNFQGRKLSRIGEKYDFRGENFHRLLTCATPKDATLPNFTEKTFANSHKTAKFAKPSPSKVSRYMIAAILTNMTAMCDVPACGMLRGWIKVSLDTIFTILGSKTLVYFTTEAPYPGYRQLV